MKLMEYLMNLNILKGDLDNIGRFGGWICYEYIGNDINEKIR